MRYRPGTVAAEDAARPSERNLGGLGTVPEARFTFLDRRRGAVRLP